MISCYTEMRRQAREGLVMNDAPKRGNRIPAHRSGVAPKSERLKGVLAIAEESGLLRGTRTKVVRGRMPEALVNKAKARTGITSDTDLLEVALANLAVADDYPEWLLARNHCAAIGRAFRGMAVDKSRFPDAVLRVYQDAAAEPGALTAMVNYYRALLRSPRRTRHGAPRIETPTLMIWGEEDTALGKELTFGTEEYVRDLTLRYLPRVSHWVQQEAPEKVNEMIEAWLLGKNVPYASQGQASGAAASPASDL